jgi:hypothetical protein
MVVLNVAATPPRRRQKKLRRKRATKEKVLGKSRRNYPGLASFNLDKF